MRKITTGLAAVPFAALVAACVAPAQIPDTPAVNQALAGKGYQLGAEVETIEGVDINQRGFIDPRNMFLTAGDGREYLVNLKEPCNGLPSKPATLRSGKGNSLSKYDRFITWHEQSHVDTCYVDAIYELERS